MAVSRAMLPAPLMKLSDASGEFNKVAFQINEEGMEVKMHIVTHFANYAILNCVTSCHFSIKSRAVSHITQK